VASRKAATARAEAKATAAGNAGELRPLAEVEDCDLPRFKGALHKVLGSPSSVTPDEVSFRPGQLQVLRCINDRSNLLLSLPTGGGKNLIAEVAAVAGGGGLVVVVTWLVTVCQAWVHTINRKFGPGYAWTPPSADSPSTSGKSASNASSKKTPDGKADTSFGSLGHQFAYDWWGKHRKNGEGVEFTPAGVNQIPVTAKGGMLIITPERWTGTDPASTSLRSALYELFFYRGKVVALIFDEFHCVWMQAWRNVKTLIARSVAAVKKTAILAMSCTLPRVASARVMSSLCGGPSPSHWRELRMPLDRKNLVYVTLWSGDTETWRSRLYRSFTYLDERWDACWMRAHSDAPECACDVCSEPVESATAARCTCQTCREIPAANGNTVVCDECMSHLHPQGDGFCAASAPGHVAAPQFSGSPARMRKGLILVHTVQQVDRAVDAINVNPHLVMRYGGATGHHAGMTKLDRSRVINEMWGSPYDNVSAADSPDGTTLFWVVATASSIDHGLDKGDVDVVIHLFGALPHPVLKHQADGRVGRKDGRVLGLCMCWWCPHELSSIRWFVQRDPLSDLSAALLCADVVTRGQCRRNSMLVNGLGEAPIPPEERPQLCCDVCTHSLRPLCPYVMPNVPPHELAATLLDAIRRIEAMMVHSKRPRDCVPYRAA
jgi:hypothetical protein